MDVSFLYLEDRATVMHVGTVMVFDPPEGGFDYTTLLRHIAARIAFVPRYRQRVRQVPGRLANPVWVDDERFDLSYHVRRSALPRPGTLEQLRDLVARVQPRRMDRSRPLWELYVVEGLQDGRFAVITKTHQALVDGVHAVDLAQVVLDDSATTTPSPPDTWRPSPEPSLAELVSGAVAEAWMRPTVLLDTFRAGLSDLHATAGKAVDALGGLAVAAKTATSPAPDSPLNVVIGEHRRFGTVTTDLADYRAVRDFHALGGRAARRRRSAGRSADAGGDAGTRGDADADPAADPSRGAGALTVNDVVLATLTGALRQWMLTRGARVAPQTTLRALVPVSVRGEPVLDGTRFRPHVEALLIDLPLGEPSPAVQLQQVAYQMKAHADTGRSVPAHRLADVAGFAPATLHSLGVRVAGGLARRVFNLVVTNVPGPQDARYVAGAPMVSSYPVIPLAKGQGLAVGVTSYRGGVYYGLNADREAMPDLDVLCQCVTDALGELRETVR